MSTIVTRAGKGSPLTNNEVDANFTNLNTDKIQVTGTPVVGYTILWNGSAWVPGVSGSGDVTGPASSTDNALVRFDSTTGKLIQNSLATLSDTGALATANVTADYYAWNTGAGVSPSVGQRAWDANQGTTALGLLGGNVITRDGQSLVAYVTNAEAVTITKGQAVYLFSAVGDRASVKLAYNTGDATSAKTLGLVAEDIAAGASGFVMCQGVAYKMDTSAYTAGDSLYLGATAGSVTTTKPYAPNHLVYIGTVEKANAGNGQIYVRVQNGYELDELHNVSAQSPTTGQTIVYNSSTNLWEKNTVSLTVGVNGTLPVANGGTGVTTSTGSGSVVLSTSPTLVTPALGTPTSGNFSTGTFTWPTFNQNTTGTASNVTGTVAIANGGTGQTTANDAFNALAPSQTGNLGKFLTTDGTNTSWAATASAVTLSNDTSTATNLYPLFANATTGTASTIYTGNAKLLYKPSTGELASSVVNATNGIVVNSQTVAVSYTIASGSSGMSAGPVTVASGQSVTISSGSRWVVV